MLQFEATKNMVQQQRVLGHVSKNTWSCMAAPFPCFNSSQEMSQVIRKKVIGLSSIHMYMQTVMP